jgi:hypothetical protein
MEMNDAMAEKDKVDKLTFAREAFSKAPSEAAARRLWEALPMVEVRDPKTGRSHMAKVAPKEEADAAEDFLTNLADEAQRAARARNDRTFDIFSSRAQFGRAYRYLHELAYRPVLLNGYTVIEEGSDDAAA